MMMIEGLGSAVSVSSPSESWQSLPAKRYLVHFELKMLLIRAILSTYSRKIPTNLTS